MGENEVIRTGLDPRKMASKKFVAYLVYALTIKAVLVLAVLKFGDKLTFWEAFFLVGTILIDGFVAVGYIIGQGSLDKYVRVAEIAASVGHDVKMKDLELKVRPKTPEPAINIDVSDLTDITPPGA